MAGGARLDRTQRAQLLFEQSGFPELQSTLELPLCDLGTYERRVVELLVAVSQSPLGLALHDVLPGVEQRCSLACCGCWQIRQRAAPSCCSPRMRSPHLALRVHAAGATKPGWVKSTSRPSRQTEKIGSAPVRRGACAGPRRATPLVDGCEVPFGERGVVVEPSARGRESGRHWGARRPASLQSRQICVASRTSEWATEPCTTPAWCKRPSGAAARALQGI